MIIRRTPMLLLAGLAGLLAASPGRTGGSGTNRGPDGQPAPNVPGSVEVRFANGSVVMMTLLQEKIEVLTEYGKLTVPHKDIRQIEFGVRTTAEETRKIDDALRRLSSNAYQEREAAVRDLVALGPRAHLRLGSAAAGEDPEAVRRVQSVLSQIRQKFHPRLLRRREDDVVRTAKFTVVGRITTPTLKAKVEEFGELDLRPERLLVIRWLVGEMTKDAVIDAAIYGSPGDRKWLDTGVRVDPYVGLRITATGQVDLWPQQPGQYMAGPDGQVGAGGGGVVVGRGRPVRLGTGTSGGELVGRIGEDGRPFLVGSRHTQTPGEAGKLYLQIVPSPWGNASTGEYRVKITTGPFADDNDGDE
jgi:hypothetical protein